MVNQSGFSSTEIVTAALAVATTSIALYLLFRYRRKQAEYEYVGVVSSLHCYPIKSCSSLIHDVAYCTTEGLRVSNVVDRHFLIVRPNGDFVSLRHIAKMAGLKLKVDNFDLVLQADGMPDIRVPIKPESNAEKTIICRVWQDHLPGQDCGQEISLWLSKYLEEEGLRLLVSLPNMEKRNLALENKLNSDKVAYSNKAVYLVTTQESLKDLRERIKTDEGEIEMRNFRPNIVIAGSPKAWDEDEWVSMKIGKKLVMRCQEGCGRCIQTTVNLDSMERRKDKEPLNTLKSFRLPPNKPSPIFGVYTAVDVEAEIRVGDPVYVTRK